jgi:hypothetical protein
MSLGLDEMRKAIREKDPVRPSTRFATLEGEDLTTTAKRRSTEISKLVHQLKGDLDWIVMKALEKDRQRRYETANGLAADLKRHLSNETVVARPPSSAYRFQKLVRRNKLAFTAGVAIAVALLLGIIASTSQAIRATHAKQEALAAQAEAVAAQAAEARLRQQADAARGQAEGLASFMIQDLQPALKDYGRLSLLKQVDEKTVEYFAALPANLRNAKTELAQADAISALTGILAAAGDMKSAQEKGLEALGLYQSLAKRHPEIPEATAGALNREWESYSHGPAHSTAEADAYQQDILRRWHELAAKFPDIDFLPLGMGQALGDRATFAAFQLNRPQEAIAAQMEIQDKLRKEIALHPENKALPAYYAEGLAGLATGYAALGDQDKAVQVSEEAEAFFDKAVKEDPGNLALLSQAASAAQALSYRVSYISQKRSRDAELVARERYRTLTALDPSNADWRHGFVMTHMMECYYLEGTGDIAATRQALKKFDSLLQDLAQTTKLSEGDADKLPQNSMDLAHLAAYSGDKADARAQLTTGETRFQARYDKLPAGSLDRILARVRWLHLKSEVISTLEDWAELERLARESLTVIADGLEQRPGDSELRLRRAVAQTYLGTALVSMDNAREAVAPLEEAMTGFRDTPPAITFAESRESYAGNAAFNLAEALVKTGDLARAKNLTESNIARIESGLAKQPESHELKADVAYCLVQLAEELDPAKPEEAARRQSALDRASAYFNSPVVLATGIASDKETLAKIESLRGASAAKPEIKQP